jgi:sugar phosphate isomerase/epimerase
MSGDRITLSRRSLGMLGLGAALLPAAQAAAQSATGPLTDQVGNVRIGCNTYTFDGLTLDGAIEGMKLTGFTTAELHAWHVEPSFTSIRLPRRPPLSNDQIRLTGYARQALRDWRLNVPLETFSEIANKFQAAGIKIVAFNYLFGSLDDAEIDRVFQMAKALRVDLITAVADPATLRRLDAFAQHYKVRVGIHNETAIPTIEAFEAARSGLSDYTGYTLDIGHFIANGGDPIAMLKKNHDRILSMHFKDRRKNGGPTVPFGEGDTPIREVLRWMRDNRFNPPTNIEQEAPGFDRLAIARQALSYCTTALAT